MEEQVVDAAEETQEETNSQNMWSRPIESSDAIDDSDQDTEVQEPADKPDEQSEPPVQEQDSQPVTDEEPAEDLEASEEPGQSEPQAEAEGDEPTDDVPDKENPERFQYWQSKAQKTENELRELKDKYGDVDDDYVTLAKNIQQDPKALEYLESYLNGDPKQPQRAPSQQQDPEQALKQLERPQRPTKPENYDKVDAVSDPDSESFKYQQQLVEYQESLADYNDTKDKLKQQVAAKKQQKRKQKQQVEQQKQQVATELRKGYGYSEERVEDFMNFMSNTEQTLDSYVKFYEALNGQSQQPKQNRQPQPKPKSATKDKNPPPAGVAGGTNPKDPAKNMWGQEVSG